MKIENQIMAYCPYCNKHTLHKVSVYHSNPQGGQTVGTRRHNRAISGYTGTAEARLHPKKLGKRQKLMLKCTVCGKFVERSLFGRAKKKIEVKR
jgi:large subunit ribosomal protein L44e